MIFRLKDCLKHSVLLAVLLMASLFAHAADPAKSLARISPAWLRDGVIYEIFPRDFSAAGNLNGVTARLDQLKDLGVNMLWIMPIHPIGEKCRKGDFGSPYSIRDYYAVDPNYGTLDDFKRLVAEAHQARPESHHGSRGQPHRVGQRDDDATRIFTSRTRRENHLAGSRLDGRGRVELCQPAACANT